MFTIHRFFLVSSSIRVMLGPRSDPKAKKTDRDAFYPCAGGAYPRLGRRDGFPYPRNLRMASSMISAVAVAPERVQPASRTARS